MEKFHRRDLRPLRAVAESKKKDIKIRRWGPTRTSIKAIEAKMYDLEAAIKASMDTVEDEKEKPKWGNVGWSV